VSYIWCSVVGPTTHKFEAPPIRALQETDLVLVTKVLEIKNSNTSLLQSMTMSMTSSSCLGRVAVPVWRGLSSSRVRRRRRQQQRRAGGAGPAAEGGAHLRVPRRARHVGDAAAATNKKAGKGAPAKRRARRKAVYGAQRLLPSRGGGGGSMVGRGACDDDRFRACLFGSKATSFVHT
jgi:hypothetical protein